jgi:hypothetical protein
MAYRAYSIIKRDGQDDYWLPLGAAFEHADGKGYNVILQAYPLDGKIVLREPNADDRNGRERQEPADQQRGRPSRQRR